MRIREFLRTNEGRLHSGRIGGLIYAIALVPGCRAFLVVEPLCLARIITTVGWWLCFAEKRPAYHFSELVHPRGIVGIVFMVFGLAAQFYFVEHR